ncbi:MAG: GNAT family N-acetyltransferase [Sphingomonadaceae bacterium]|nr:GNAT family N-acetyltransferase [Sphingomonadaceae bacterium]
MAGCYWPFRSFPISSDADDGELADFLAHGGTVRALGRLWRLGPVYADDPTAQRLIRAAPEAGWTVLKRSLGSVYELDLAALRQDGPWPSTKTKRKNRWRERRLAEDGEVRYEYFTGADWTRAQRDAMAEVEANCWLAGLEDGGDTKFQDSDARVVWEKACSDEALAPLLFGSLMWIGTTPVAFTFGVETGDTRYYVANNYDQRFSKFGPGKLLLYADFERAAAENGIARISWGAGDAGYKTEMGAQSGPEILDLLFVRGKALGALIRPLFLRGTKGSD